MAESSTANEILTNSQNQAVNYNDPYYLSSGDNPRQQLGRMLLSGDNFINWSRSVKMALGAKNKLGFIDGSLHKPAEDSVDYNKWIRNDYMVMSWLTSSMEPVIFDSFIFATSAHDLWTDVADRFGNYGRGQGQSNFKKDFKRSKLDLICDHFKRKGHTADQCFKLVGYPEWCNTMKSKITNPRMAANAISESVDTPRASGENSSFDSKMVSAVYQEVLKMMQQQQMSPLSENSQSYVNFAGIVSAFQVISNASHNSNISWIIDTGASDHIVSVGVLEGPLNSTIQAVGTRDAGLYRFSSQNSICPQNLSLSMFNSCCHSTTILDVNTFHARLGHLSVGKMQHLKMFTTAMLNNFHCDSCILPKHHKLPYNESNSRAPAVFHMLHIYLWGPYRVPTQSGCKYFLTILDDHSRVTWTHLLVSKDQVAQIISAFLAMFLIILELQLSILGVIMVQKY
ncbi:uncharacterized protein LOC141708711 [Apium graveolens]|uniref:uncharacterized protein LOC141708711 n=1 Tax=Apium graveolens TaxID=4045 RepID=UPI003D79F84C